MKKFFAEISRSAGPVRVTLMFLLPFLFALTIFLSLLIAWEKKKMDEDQLSELKETARAFFEQIMITRIWNAQHGGVYVEVSAETPPNPYLEVPDRDIVSVNGKRYTKINPAYMTRQLSEIANQRHGYKFHIVSIRPVNPYNMPDGWEKNVLEEFEKGKSAEAATVFKEYDGSRFFRYLVPLKIEEPCLRCHAKHGYGYGDIKGGIGISIPMEKSDIIYSMKLRRMVISLLIIGSVSILFVAAITLYLSRRLSHEIEKNIEREKLAAIVELAGATAHEMRQPITVVHNLISLIDDKFKHNESITEDEIDIITNQCARMNNIIKKMLNITSYRTKDYIKGKKIIDLDESSMTEDPDEKA